MLHGSDILSLVYLILSETNKLTVSRVLKFDETKFSAHRIQVNSTTIGLEEDEDTDCEAPCDQSNDPDEVTYSIPIENDSP